MHPSKFFLFYRRSRFVWQRWPGWIRICDHSSQSGPPCLLSPDAVDWPSYDTFAAAALKLPGWCANIHK